jgi:hypothetical protein
LRLFNLRSLNKKNIWIYLLVAAVLFGAVFGEEENLDLESSPSPTPSSIQATPTPESSADPSPSASASPSPRESRSPEPSASPSTSTAPNSPALEALAKLPVKGRAPKTGYSREQFSDGWGSFDGCDTRNRILKRDFESFVTRADSWCLVETGVLNDPYTGKRIEFVRGVRTSLEVQIDHVVALSDAWQKGAQLLSATARRQFYDDPLNLLAVAGWANSQKSDSDAASWLPPNKAFRCEFVSIQIAVKLKYSLWVTSAEADSMRRVLRDCPNQALPGG